MKEDWTSWNGRSNSSPTYSKLVDTVEQIIRNSAHTLISGNINMVARTIMSHLAHERGLSPRGVSEENKQEVHELFHRLWTKAVGTKDYEKKEWLLFEQYLEKACPHHEHAFRSCAVCGGTKCHICGFKATVGVMDVECSCMFL